MEGRDGGREEGRGGRDIALYSNIPHYNVYQVQLGLETLDMRDDSAIGT